MSTTKVSTTEQSVDSQNFHVVLHLFSCGHGDTLVLRLPGPKWVLVDCHLPKSNGVYDRFLSFLDQLAQAEGNACFLRFDWVILTHPDIDHFLGMSALLEHFSRDGRSVGKWLSSGLSAHHFRSLAWPDSQVQRGFQKLQLCVQRLSREGLLQREIIMENSYAISPSGYRGQIDLFPLAPSAETVLSTAEADLGGIKGQRDRKLQSNVLSVVLIVSLKQGDHDCNLLLSGDAGPSELHEALATWQSRAEEYNRRTEISVVKIPHHGSQHSHWDQLPKLRGEGRSIAAVSAGDRPNLPHGDVLRDYLQNGWTVVATKKSFKGGGGFNRPFTLSDRGNRVRLPSREFDVAIKWQSNAGICFSPSDAEIGPTDLNGKK